MLLQPNQDIPTLFSMLFVLMVAFSVHEFAHAWTADYFGDNTPRSQGRLTLNPMAHLDPVGTLLLLVFGFGWARPVPVDPYKLGQRNFMLTALAGPMSNLLMAVFASSFVWAGLLSFSPVQNGPIFPTVYNLASVFVQINLLLMLFNLIPLFPLDGEKVITYFLPPDGQDFMDRIRPYGMMILMAVVFILPGVFNLIIMTPLSFLFDLLFVSPSFSQFLQSSLMGFGIAV